MRNVTRVPKPATLTKNARRWKTEYLDARARGDAKLIARCRARYNHPKVRSALDTMYRNLCCYCESQVGPVRADQIEHRMPVDGFPGRAFEWENLHLACGGCNGAKSNKWDAAHPILDAVADIPINTHLDYCLSETGVRRVWRTPRGRTTAKHADLNRAKLRMARVLVFSGVLGVIQAIRDRVAQDPNDVEAANAREKLSEKCLDEYGSMILWSIAKWLDPYVAQP